MSVFVVRLLGPFEASLDGVPVPIPAGKPRTLLASLAVRAGRVVSPEDLAAALWGEVLPAHPLRSLQTYAVRLRAICGGARVRSRAAGFSLDVDPQQVDVLRFLRLLDEAGGDSDEQSRLAEALRLWRGEPLDGVGSDWLRQREVPEWTERYLLAWERRADLAVAGGAVADVLPDLRAVAGRYPLRESLWARLMSALHHGGRDAEALEAFAVIRDRLAADLGVDPGAELRQLHARVLAAPATPAAPRRLPVPVADLVGRGSAVRALDRLVDDAARVAVISGTAGVGKTTLAVWWAHRVADRFPDGQVYLDLGGFGPSEAARGPGEVLRELLEALGVAPADVPSGAQPRAELARRMLAGRQVLVLLDNARDAAQVRPLLTCCDSGLVIVTSRTELVSVIVATNAGVVPLDVLSPEDAGRLLAQRAGTGRVAAEPEAVRSIVLDCARLPLALAIVGARARLHPALPLRELAGELGATHDDLGVFDIGDGMADVRAVFSWSLRALSPDAVGLFGSLGLHPGGDITVAAAASLADRTADVTRALLAELRRANLLTQRRAGRYTMHDLLRTYARELAFAGDEPARRAAMQRFLAYQAASAYAADRVLDPNRDTPLPAPSSPYAEVFADQAAAQTWLADEHPGLLTVMRYAEKHGFDEHVGQLAWAWTTFLDRRGLWHDWASVQQHALVSAERTGDRGRQAHAHQLHGRALTRLREDEAAYEHFTAAVAAYRAVPDPLGEAITHINLGWLREEQGDYATARTHNEQALALFAQSGHLVGQAKAFNGIGWDQAHLGDLAEALANCDKALSIHHELGHHYGLAETWDSLGYVHRLLGDVDASVDSYRRAMANAAAIGAHATQAALQWHLGEVLHEHDDTDGAQAAFDAARRLLQQLPPAEAGLVAARLRRSATRPDGERP